MVLNTRMSRLPPKLESEMTPAVKAFVLSLLEQVDQLTGQVEKLTPRNSSIPPSTEHPHAKPKRKSSPGEKLKQGGQKGHKRRTRELIPSEDCRSVIPCLPDACRRCGGDLQPDDGTPQRHQVWDLPEIKPLVDEF